MFLSSSKVNIKDIYREIYEKKSKKISVYESILHKCQKRISEHAKRELFCMIFDVPEFVFTIPSYDMKTCIVYIIKNLRENGFYVKYYFPKILFISWDIRHIHNKHVIEDAVLDMDKELQKLVIFDKDIAPPQSQGFAPPQSQGFARPAITMDQQKHDGMASIGQFPFKTALHAAKPSGKLVVHLD